ncbi:MAG: DUF3644 domain-containing protein [Zymomonas mobilis]
MAKNRKGSLKHDEKRIIKALLSQGWRNQDIQALVNIGRKYTINGARITEVKKDDSIVAATKDEVHFFEVKQHSFDEKTGLNPFVNERLIRAREAMILAVQVFNNPTTCFKSEVFTMLANVAWTYLIHEFYEQNDVNIVGCDGRTLLLSKAIERNDCPFNDGVKNNLRSLKKLRDEVEHKLLGRADFKWLGLFQACCLNFDRVLCQLFGKKLTLARELSFALQFSKLDFSQTTTLNRYEIPEHIDAIDARLHEDMTEEQIADLDYQFRVVYTLDAVSKSRAHFQFVNPDSTQGKEIHNVLVRHQLSDSLYPHKAGDVVNKVKNDTGKKFTTHNHTQAWKFFNVRPASGGSQPENTNKEYCIYHPVYNSYTYSDSWIEYLKNIVKNDEEFSKLKLYKFPKIK